MFNLINKLIENLKFSLFLNENCSYVPMVKYCSRFLNSNTSFWNIECEN